MSPYEKGRGVKFEDVLKVDPSVLDALDIPPFDFAFSSSMVLKVENSVAQQAELALRGIR